MFSSLAERLVLLAPARYQNSARQFTKFLVTGTIGAIVDFGTYNILTRGFDWSTTYHIGSFEIIAANLVSVFLAITTNFFINKYWTFRNTDEAVAKQWAGYFALNTITFILNQLLTSFFTFDVALTTLIFGSQRDNAAKALAIGIILSLNFLGSKFLVFRKK